MPWTPRHKLHTGLRTDLFRVTTLSALKAGIALLDPLMLKAGIALLKPTMVKACIALLSHLIMLKAGIALLNPLMLKAGIALLNPIMLKAGIALLNPISLLNCTPLKPHRDLTCNNNNRHPAFLSMS